MFSFGRSPSSSAPRVFPVDASRAISVPAAAFEAALESLFLPDAEDDRSITRTVADALLLSSSDLRRATLAAVQLTGGLAAIAGFEERLVSHLARYVEEDERYHTLREVVGRMVVLPPLHWRPYLPWIGGAATKILFVLY